ncbi:MAG TPA: hypothetical protein VIV12_15750 [Streptosporangiaceae bacterium]
MSNDPRQGAHAKAAQEGNAFAQFEIQDYVENPLLIQVLRVNVDNAQATISRLIRSERTLTRERDQLKQRLSDELIAHEKTRGKAETSTTLLQKTVSSLQDQIGEMRRLSAVALVIAWVGTALVAIGVNLLTGRKTQVLGLTIMIAGASVEVAAFFVRRHSRTRKDNP